MASKNEIRVLAAAMDEAKRVLDERTVEYRRRMGAMSVLLGEWIRGGQDHDVTDRG